MDRKPVIALLAAPSTSASVLYGLYDVLFSAGTVFLDMVLGEPGVDSLEVKILSLDGRPFHCAGGVPVEPHGSLEGDAHYDAVLVCDMYSPIHTVPRQEYADYRDFLRRQHAGGALIGSVCSGALVLAEAGLLEGREVASHWAYAELFAREYPRAKLQRGSILCLTHAREGIVTAGGVTSWHELVLYVIGRFCGADVARQTGRVHLLAGHEDGQLPFAAMNRRCEGPDRVIASCQAWIAENYQTDNPVQRMAAQTGLNPRTFARRFRAATGRSPQDYVVELRIEEAKQVLEVTDMAIDEVSWSVGYQDPAAFRRMFRRLAGMSPLDYRRRFARAGRVAAA
jgi:transcriptional regulator GlxA family with amidase domain